MEFLEVYPPPLFFPNLRFLGTRLEFYPPPLVFPYLENKGAGGGVKLQGTPLIGYKWFVGSL